MAVPLSVVAAVADIAAITVDKTLTPIARTGSLRIRRNQALGAHLVAALAVSNRVVLNGWVVTIQRVVVASDRVDLFGVTAIRPSVPVSPLDPHRVFVNPPLLFPDPAGNVPIARQTPDPKTGLMLVTTQMHRIDPAAVILNEIITAAEAGGP